MPHALNVMWTGKMMQIGVRWGPIGSRWGPIGSDVVRLGPMGSDWVISHTHRTALLDDTDGAMRRSSYHTTVYICCTHLAIKYLRSLYYQQKTPEEEKL